MHIEAPLIAPGIPGVEGAGRDEEGTGAGLIDVVVDDTARHAVLEEESLVQHAHDVVERAVIQRNQRGHPIECNRITGAVDHRVVVDHDVAGVEHIDADVFAKHHVVVSLVADGGLVLGIGEIAAVESNAAALELAAGRLPLLVHKVESHDVVVRDVEQINAEAIIQ